MLAIERNHLQRTAEAEYSQSQQALAAQGRKWMSWSTRNAAGGLPMRNVKVEPISSQWKLSYAGFAPDRSEPPVVPSSSRTEETICWALSGFNLPRSIRWSV